MSTAIISQTWNTVIFGHVCGFYYLTATRREYLPQVSIAVDTQIISSTSRTTLTQSFLNPKAEEIPELRYTFPLYDGVSVVSFKCTIDNDRVITGIVKEKAEARKAYTEAIERGETAALLEQLPEASDVFTTTVGNVPANAKLDVEITYLGELKHDAGTDGIRFTIPTAIAPRYSAYPGEVLKSNAVNPGGISITIDAEMADGSNIKTIQSPTHPISVTVGNTSKGTASGAEMSLRKASATLALGTAELDKDFVLHVVATNIDEPVAILETHARIPNQRALMATLVPKFNLPSSRPEIVFLADRSGSMGMGSRIPDLKTALRLFLKSLPVGVKFNICSFGTHHEFLFGDGSQSYDASTLEKATRYVDRFAADFGGTNIYSPLEDAINKRFKDMNLEVFLLTDGEIWDQQRLFEMLNEKVPESKGAIRVFSLGIGNDVSHSLIEGVARAGSGFAQVVGENENMNSKVVRMLKASLTPHVTDYTMEVKYGKDVEAPPAHDADDGFEIVEKVMDSLTISVEEPKQEDAAAESQKPISLFDKSADPDVEMIDPNLDTSAGGKYSHVPVVSEPKMLQAPFVIPSLFPFSRTTVYLLLSPETIQKQPKSVVLRGKSAFGPLELEIPVTVLPEKGETIHQLAARKATRELEDGRGWIYHAKDESGKLLKDKHEGRFQDMVEREAVRLGVTYQVGGKWTSFVAVEAKDGTERAPESPESPSPAIANKDRRSRAPLRMMAKTSQTMQQMAPPPALCSAPGFGGPAFGAMGGSSGLPGAAGGALMSITATPAAAMSLASSPAPPVPRGGGGGLLSKAMMALPIDPSYGRSANSAQLRTESLLPRREFASKAARKSPQPALNLGKNEEDEEDLDEEEEEEEEEEEDTADFAVSGTAGDALTGIVALQTFEGKWAWSEKLLVLLGLNKDAVEAQKSDEVATAMVLAYLEVKLADRKDEWEMLAEKAQDWLRGQGLDVDEQVGKVKGLF
ncbi:von Willebrand factor A domain-containing protein 5A [Cladorrhinum samala]|uniref:von Willebrand factor A domain-containing protein 5A n=1 Tax=Cladorrhinum samala TaxID=585594 RepID=A0AAV9HM67_9PEZI|nr:von Willebrand factor A domain-containing protein 5A [Cladorrhinum samala]